VKQLYLFVIPLFSVVFLPAIVSGNRYASLPDISAVALLAMVLLPWALTVSHAPKRSRLILILRLALILLLAAIALYQTIDFSATDTSYNGYSEYEVY